MAFFTSKTWKNRVSQFPNRRKLTPTGEANTYDVARDEGQVPEAGDAFNDANMNNLERRLVSAFDTVEEETKRIPKTIALHGAATGSATELGGEEAISIPVTSLRSDEGASTVFTNPVAFLNRHVSISGTNLTGAPETGVVWYEVATFGMGTRAYQIARGCYSHQRRSYTRYMHDGTWSAWFADYTENNQPGSPGIWTPTISPDSLSTTGLVTSGKYYRVGKLVYATLYASWTTSIYNARGVIAFDGLPFAAAALNPGTVAMGFIQNAAAVTMTGVPVGVAINANTPQRINIWSPETGGYLAMASSFAQLKLPGSIEASITYVCQ